MYKNNKGIFTIIDDSIIHIHVDGTKKLIKENDIENKKFRCIKLYPFDKFFSDTIK